MLSKRIYAAFMVSLFILSVAAMAAPSLAHHTLGVQTDGTDPSNMYRAHDVDSNLRHVFGPTGYVFPGGGKDWITGLVSVPPNEFPGYQSPWTNYPPQAPNFNWWQLRGTSYTPFGAILASTEDYDNIGDLIFGINFTTLEPSDINRQPTYNYTELEIYIPPEFTPVAQDWEAGEDNNIITTITNDWGDINVRKADVKDPFGPGWWVIEIYGDINFLNNQWSQNNWDEWYYIRVNGLAAPKIAGRYFFKMFLNSSYPKVLVDTPPTFVDAAQAENANAVVSTMPVENYPVLLVKGELDPAIAYGTVRFGGYDPAIYGDPIPLAGRVRFVGEAIDPYTSEPTGRNVEARGYFNGTAVGHWEVEGIAPGIYDIYASAAGYPEQLIAENQLLLAGKSLHYDIYLNPGAIVCTEVFAKHKWGETVWGETAASWWWNWFDTVWAANDGAVPPAWDPASLPLPISIEIYDDNEWPEPAPGYVWGEVDGTVADYMEFELGGTEWTFGDTGYERDPLGHLMSFSPKNLTDSPFTSYDWNYPAAGPNLIPVAFPFDDVTMPTKTVYPGYGTAVRHNGVGPPQVWWVNPTDSNFQACFGSKFGGANGDVTYGAPTEYDGHVPQVFATWVNGLEPGTYYARVWVPGFVQTDAAGNYVDYMFTVGQDEWAADIQLWIDLQLNGYIMKEVHFHDLPGTLDTDPILGPDDYRWLVAEARDASGNLVAFNFVPVDWSWESVQIPLWGFGWSGYEHDNIGNGPGIAQRWGVDPYSGNFPTDKPWTYFMYKYRHIRDYGMMPGTYTIYVYMRGYVQQEFEMASITLSGDETYISNHMYRGAGINVTVYSMDSQVPPVFRDWINGVLDINSPTDRNRGWCHDDDEDIEVTVIRGEDDADMGLIHAFGLIDGDLGWGVPTQLQNVETVPNAAWTKWVNVRSYLKFNGSIYMELDGPDDGKDASTPEYEDERYNNPEKQEEYGFVYDAGYYRDDDFQTVVALETGEYYFSVSTAGYVYKHAGPDDKFVVFAQKGQQADGPLKLVIGARISPTIIFKKEGIFDHARWNITVRMHLLDETGSEVDCLTENVPYSTESVTWIDGFSGLDAYPNYEGDWTLHTVTYINYWGSVWDFGPDAWFGWGNFRYGIPDALLAGYDYGVVGGEVWGDMDFNHLGPYEQKLEITVPNVQLGGEASPVFELDLMGYVTGQIAGYTWSGDVRTISWANVMLSGAAGDFESYSFDGEFEMFAPAGDDYLMTIEEWPGAGHEAVSVSMSVPDGGAVTQNFLQLEQSEVAIPEFPVALLPTLAALGSSIYLLRRRR